MSQLQRTVNHCDICTHEWIPTPGVMYTHCTSGKCRSRKWNQTERDAIVKQLQDRLDGKKTGINDGPPNSIIRDEPLYERDEYSQA